MKHYPAQRFHPALAGLSYSRPPRPRACTALVACVAFTSGFFIGAILFGELLLTLHR